VAWSRRRNGRSKSERIKLKMGRSPSSGWRRTKRGQRVRVRARGKGEYTGASAKSILMEFRARAGLTK
jgi:hypothetical protein